MGNAVPDTRTSDGGRTKRPIASFLPPWRRTRTNDGHRRQNQPLPNNNSQHSTNSASRQRSLHEGLVRERDKIDKFEDIYEVLEEVGRGGLCHVYKIRKRAEMIGGSSRPNVVLRRQRLKQRSLVNLAQQFSSLVPTTLKKRSLSSPSLATLARADPASSDSSTSAKNVTQPTPATVGSSTYSGTPMLFALKVFNLKLVAGGATKVDQLRNEVDLLRTLDHPSIVKVYETFQRRDTKQLMLVMELCTGGDLYARMPYTERQVALVMKQVLNAIVYMHDRNIVHRDIKLENILYESHHPQATVKLIDFGLSTEFVKAQSVLKERVGTLYSMAPETMKGRYTTQADLWSVGVVAFTMLSGGEKPFDGRTPKQMVSAVLLGRYSFDPAVWHQISPDAKDFVRRLLVVHPDERSTASQAIRHTFIAQSDAPPPEHLENVADEDLAQRIRGGIARYAARSDFYRLALNAVAKRSSSDEIFEIRKVFNQFDTENTGTITMEEFRNALDKFNYSDDDLVEIFQKVDVNKTSVINYTEFLACALEAQGGIEEHRLAEAFDLMDNDDSGYISKDDLRRILGETIEDNFIDQLIAQADFKHDGRVSYEEFLQVFAEHKRDRMYGIYEEESERDEIRTG